jgi:cation diffusion facilitator CzcD-associated flavoprotein CzcO
MDVNSKEEAYMNREQATQYARDLCDLLAGRSIYEIYQDDSVPVVTQIDDMFSGDLVTNDSFEVIGTHENVIVLRDATGFDVLLTVSCEEMTEERAAAVQIARQARLQREKDERE